MRVLGVGKERRAYAISGRHCPITPWNWSRFGGKIYQVIRYREKIEGPGVKKKKNATQRNMEVGQAISPLESFFDSPQLSVSLKVQIDRTAKWAKYACYAG